MSRNSTSLSIYLQRYNAVAKIHQIAKCQEKPVWTVFAGVAYIAAHAKAERQESFVIQQLLNAGALKACHRALIHREEICVMERATSASVQQLFQLAMGMITVLWDLALVITFENMTAKSFLLS